MTIGQASQWAYLVTFVSLQLSLGETLKGSRKMVFWCFLSIVSSQVEVSILTSGIHKCIANKVAEIRSLTLKLQIFRTANQSSHHQSYDIGHSPCRRPWPLSFLPSATLHLLPEARSLSKWRNKSMMIYECQQEMWGCWPKWQKWGPEFELGRVLFLFTCFFSFRLLFSFHPVLVLFWGNALPACCLWWLIWSPVTGKCTSGVVFWYCCARTAVVKSMRDMAFLVVLCS